MPHILTIGYEGSELHGFLRTLQQAGVTHLIDVREIPLSRKKGFSKTALRTAAEAAGIRYTHERDLGAPKPIRNRLRESGDHDEYFRHFRQYLSTQTAVLDRVARGIEGPTALMCYERDPTECHRSAVAKELADRTGSEVMNLGVNHASGTARKEANQHTRKGVSAAQHPV